MTVRSPWPMQALLEERDRLRWEVYDGLARVLSQVRLQAQDMRHGLEAGRLDRVESALCAVLSIVGQAQVAARHALIACEAYSHGPPRLSRVAAHLVERLRRSGVAAQLAIEPTWRDEVQSFLVQSHLAHIMQEAVANICLHAHASCATIRLALEGPHVGLQVEDDGRGFYLSRLVPHWLGEVDICHGLCAMRVRARAIGGTLRIESQPGQGTRIRVIVPVMAETWP